jgi:hypothetical protein
LSAMGRAKIASQMQIWRRLRKGQTGNGIFSLDIQSVWIFAQIGVGHSLGSERPAITVSWNPLNGPSKEIGTCDLYGINYSSGPSGHWCGLFANSLKCPMARCRRRKMSIRVLRSSRWLCEWTHEPRGSGELKCLLIGIFEQLVTSSGCPICRHFRKTASFNSLRRLVRG